VFLSVRPATRGNTQTVADFEAAQSPSARCRAPQDEPLEPRTADVEGSRVVTCRFLRKALTVPGLMRPPFLRRMEIMPTGTPPGQRQRGIPAPDSRHAGGCAPCFVGARALCQRQLKSDQLAVDGLLVLAAGTWPRSRPVSR
jgi:hypothetical protein